MNFNEFVKRQVIEEHRSLQRDSLVDNEIQANSILRSYPIKSTEQIAAKLHSLVPEKLRFNSQPEIAEIGKGTFLVKTPIFQDAFRSVTKILNAKKPEEVKWIRVFQNKFHDGKLSKDVVGYKFFIDENFHFDEDEIEPVLEQDYAPVDVNDYVIGAIRDGVPHIKLISILNNDTSIAKHLIHHVAEKLGVRNLSNNVLQSILHDMNTWVPINEETSEEGTKGFRLLVRIVNNNTKAFLRLIVEEGAKPPSVKKIVEVLKSRDITFGVDLESIKEMLKSKNFRNEILAAQGVEPVLGTPGFIEETAMMKAKKAESKSTDKFTKFFSPFLSVKKGDTVLRVVRSTSGTPGRDIFNRAISVTGAFDLQEDVKFGKNLYFAENGESVISKIGGNLTRSRDGIWNVEKVLELHEVGPQTGNITHLGSVIVAGSVQDGFNIVATGNIRIMKSVGSCCIESGGDIDIFLGMNGKNKGKLISHFGSVAAKFIIDCDVVADRNVKVEELLANCNVECGHLISAVGLRSSIWGGVVNSYREIVATNIGSVAERKTQVSVGIPQILRMKFKQNALVQDTKKKELKKLVDMLAGTDSSKGNIFNMSEKGENEQNVALLKEELRDLEQERKDLLKEKELSSTVAKITVKQTLYGNVTVFCNKGKLVNRRYRKGVVLLQNKRALNYIKITPYVAPVKMQKKLKEK